MKRTIQARIWEEELTQTERTKLCISYYKNEEIGRVIAERVWTRLQERLRRFIELYIQTGGSRKLKAYIRQLPKIQMGEKE